MSWNLSVALNGVAANVSITFPNLPSGISVLPAGPVTVSTDGNVAFLLYAKFSATVGSGTITVQGNNGSVTHSYSVPFTVGAAAPFQLTVSPSSLSMNTGGSAQVIASLSSITRDEVSLAVTTIDQRPPPLSVVQLAPHRALVTVRGSILRLLNLDTGSLSCSGIAGCDSSGTDIKPGPLPFVAAPTPDGSKAFISDGLSQFATLNLTSNTLTTSVGFDSPINAMGDESGWIYRCCRPGYR